MILFIISQFMINVILGVDHDSYGPGRADRRTVNQNNYRKALLLTIITLNIYSST